MCVGVCEHVCIRVGVCVSMYQSGGVCGCECVCEYVGVCCVCEHVYVPVSVSAFVSVWVLCV